MKYKEKNKIVINLRKEEARREAIIWLNESYDYPEIKEYCLDKYFRNLDKINAKN